MSAANSGWAEPLKTVISPVTSFSSSWVPPCRTAGSVSTGPPDPAQPGPRAPTSAPLGSRHEEGPTAVGGPARLPAPRARPAPLGDPAGHAAARGPALLHRRRAGRRAGGWRSRSSAPWCSGLAIWAVRDQPGPTWLAVVLGVTASGLSITAALTGSAALTLAGARSCTRCSTSGRPPACSATCCPTPTSPSDELWAVGATFTLVAWAFAYVFAALQQVVPGQLHRRGRPGRAADLAGAAVPQLHQPVEHRALRRRARSCRRRGRS